MAETGQSRIHLADVGMVAVLLLLAYGVRRPASPGLPEPGDVADMLVGLTALPLLVWRWLPVQAFATVAAVAAVYLVMGYPFGPVMFQLIAATALLTWQRRGRVLLVVGAAYGVLLTGVFTVRYLQFSRDPWQMLSHWPASSLLWGVLPAVVGILLRVRKEAEVRTRTEQSRRAVSEEQLRMAQELHDVVGHGLAVIAMQAGSGQHVLEQDPARARQALQAIEETARASLAGLRTEIAALGAAGSDDSQTLRDAGGVSSATTGGRGSAPLRPHEGVADLPRLVARIRGGGLAVDLDLDPALDPGTPPAEVDHAAYRIVQESLTNVLRHAGTHATARVRVHAAATGLLVEVTNTGSADADDPVHTVVAGAGLHGMHDRARRVGGRLEAVPQAGGGFCVTARLPLPALAREQRP